MYSNDSQYFGELVSVFVHMYKPVIALALHGYTVHELQVQPTVLLSLVLSSITTQYTVARLRTAASYLSHSHVTSVALEFTTNRWLCVLPRWQLNVNVS